MHKLLGRIALALMIGPFTLAVLVVPFISGMWGFESVKEGLERPYVWIFSAVVAFICLGRKDTKE